MRFPENRLPANTIANCKLQIACHADGWPLRHRVVNQWLRVKRCEKGTNGHQRPCSQNMSSDCNIVHNSDASQPAFEAEQAKYPGTGLRKVADAVAGWRSWLRATSRTGRRRRFTGRDPYSLFTAGDLLSLAFPGLACGHFRRALSCH